MILLCGLFAVLYVLWTLYLAVMNLKRARDAGTLILGAKIFGYPLLYLGLVLDVLGNLLLVTVMLAELPHEWTISQRVKRWYHTVPASKLEVYRVAVATWVAVNLLNAFDPDGPHV